MAPKAALLPLAVMFFAKVTNTDKCHPRLQLVITTPLDICQ